MSIRTLLISVLILFGSCEKRANDSFIAKFSTSAAVSKAYGTNWTKDDRIGIFMLKHNSDFISDNIVDGVVNIEYAADRGGGHCYFRAVSPTQTIVMPSDGSAVDFCAYYPHSETMYSGYSIPVNVQNQSDLEAIDYMVSDRVMEKSILDNNAALTFNHVLSLLEISLEGGFGVTTEELENMALTICNTKHFGNLLVPTKAISSRSYGDIISQRAGSDHIIEAIVLPQKFTQGNYPYLKIFHRGIEYTVILDFDFIQSKRHTIKILIEDRKVYLSEQDVIIKDWIEGTGGDYGFEHKVIGDGTIELDKSLFTLDNPHWVVRGKVDGDSNQNYTVTQNIREALDALPADGSASGKITLEIENITEIPSYQNAGASKGAFEGYLQLKRVILSQSIKTIRERAFAGCSNIYSFEADGVTTLAERVFENCTGLVDVNLSSVAEAGNYTLKGCSSLLAILLPEINSIPLEMFANCASLQRCEAPNASELYERAFSGCNALTELKLLSRGEIRMYVNPFSGFTNNANCTLSLNIDKETGGGGLPQITAAGQWGAEGKELSWRAIKFE